MAKITILRELILHVKKIQAMVEVITTTVESPKDAEVLSSWRRF